MSSNRNVREVDPVLPAAPVGGINISHKFFGQNGTVLEGYFDTTYVKCVSKVLGHSLKASSAHISPRTFKTHFSCLLYTAARTQNFRRQPCLEIRTPRILHFSEIPPHLS